MKLSLDEAIAVYLWANAMKGKIELTPEQLACQRIAGSAILQAADNVFKRYQAEQSRPATEGKKS